MKTYHYDSSIVQYHEGQIEVPSRIVKQGDKAIKNYLRDAILDETEDYGQYLINLTVSEEDETEWFINQQDF